jgi:hypothetical protein
LLTFEERGAEVWVYGGFDAFSFDGDFACLAFEDVERRMADDGEVQGAVIFPGSALVLAEAHIERPVQIIFDAPVSAARGEDALGIWRQGRDVEPRFLRGGSGFLVSSQTVDRRNRLQSLPVRLPHAHKFGVAGICGG